MHSPYVKIENGADTAVLFIHGFQGSPRHFDRFVNLIPDNITVYNILLNGHGGSVKDFSKASMKIWKTQVRDTVKEIAEAYDNIYIAGHSMGTFFAMQSAIEYPDKVKGIFLLQTPLKIGVRPTAVLNSLKVFFGIKDELAEKYKNSNSIKLNLRVWEYVGWIPRYLELFGESKRAHSNILKLNTKCIIFQSAQDEFVSMRSIKYIPNKEKIKYTVMNKSAHFIYDEQEFSMLEQAFCEFIV